MKVRYSLLIFVACIPSPCFGDLPQTLDDWAKVPLLTSAIEGLCDNYTKTNLTKPVPSELAIVYVTNHRIPGRLLVYEHRKGLIDNIFLIKAGVSGITIKILDKSEISFDIFVAKARNAIKAKIATKPGEQAFESVRIYIYRDGLVEDKTIHLPLLDDNLKWIVDQFLYGSNR